VRVPGASGLENLSEQAVSPLGNGLDIARLTGVVSQRLMRSKALLASLRRLREQEKMEELVAEAMKSFASDPELQVPCRL